MANESYAILPLSYLEDMSAYSDEEFGRIAKAAILYCLGNPPQNVSGAERYVLPRVYADQERAIQKRNESKKRKQASRSSGNAVTSCDSAGNAVTSCDSAGNAVTSCDPLVLSNTPYGVSSNAYALPSSPNGLPNAPNGASKTRTSTSTPPLPPCEGAMSAHERGVDADFEAFWALYPKKRSKQQAKTAWMELNPSRETISAIMGKLQMFITSDGWTEAGGRYIQNPVNWLKGRYWEQEPINGTGRNRRESFDGRNDECPF